MAKLHIKPDCGNAPRKTWLIRFWENLASGMQEMIDESAQANKFLSSGSKQFLATLNIIC